MRLSILSNAPVYFGECLFLIWFYYYFIYLFYVSHEPSGTSLARQPQRQHRSGANQLEEHARPEQPEQHEQFEQTGELKQLSA